MARRCCSRCGVAKPAEAFAGSTPATTHRLCRSCREKARERYRSKLAPERRLLEGELQRLRQRLAVYEAREQCRICSTHEHPVFVRCRLAACGHLFCRQCIEDWHARRKRTCPACRASFSHPKDVEGV